MSDSQFSGYWWFQVLIISKCMHGLSTSMQLMLHSFMLRVVKVLLKEEVGCSALNSHRITLLILENHGKIMELCFLNYYGNPALSLTATSIVHKVWVQMRWLM